MTDLFWPGDDRAGSLMSGEALIKAMVQVEEAWLTTLVTGRVAPDDAARDLSDVIDVQADLETVARAAETGGNPVIPLVKLLRDRLQAPSPEAARWLHRGLTSQDVLDTALVLCARDSLDQVLTEIRRQVTSLRHLADEHRHSLEPGRTLTQYAVPTTFGLTASTWLSGVIDAAEDLTLARNAMSVQVGGAAGTLAAPAALARAAGYDDPSAAALGLVRDLADRLHLSPALPWHTSRRTITRLGDALVSCTDAWGHLVNDILLRTRPEVAELSEPALSGRGGSSTMPQKQNPVLSVLIRRAALTAPLVGAQLHTAAAATVDQRPDGAWHAEWAPLRTLTRNTVVAASQTAELLDGLVVHTDVMQAHVEGAEPELLAEQQALKSISSAGQAAFDQGARGYLGSVELVVAAALERADQYLKESS